MLELFMNAWEIFEGDKLKGKIKPFVIVSPFGSRHFIPYMLEKFESKELDLKYFDQRIWNSKDFTFIYAQVGPTNADLTVMLLKDSGAKEVILVGSCGGLLKEMKAGDIVIPSGFYGFDSVSQFWGGKKVHEVDPELIKNFKEIAKELGIKFFSGTSATVDSLHRQTKLNLSEFSCVEMEGAVFAAAASKIGYRFGAVLWVSDVPVKGEKLREPLSKGNREGIDKAWKIIERYLKVRKA